MAVKTKKSRSTSKTLTPQAVSLPNPFAQSVAGKYFLGQSEILTLGEGKYSWGGLINPSIGSKVICECFYRNQLFRGAIYSQNMVKCQSANHRKNGDQSKSIKHQYTTASQPKLI